MSTDSYIDTIVLTLVEPLIEVLYEDSAAMESRSVRLISRNTRHWAVTSLAHAMNLLEVAGHKEGTAYKRIKASLQDFGE